MLQGDQKNEVIGIEELGQKRDFFEVGEYVYAAGNGPGRERNW